MGIHSSIAKSYNINLFDKGIGKNDLIISLGSGMLMATQDLLPEVRYSFEFNKNISIDAIFLFANYVDKIWVTAWFSISKPVLLHQALEPVSHKVIYYSNEILVGKRCETLKQLKHESIFDFKKDLV